MRCGNGTTGTRNRALLTSLYRAGLRVSEACSQSPKDLRRTSGGLVLRVSHPKGEARGARHREVGLDVRTTEILDEWLELRDRAAPTLFYTRTGRALLPSYVRTLLTRLGRESHLERRVHPHALRHSFAAELYDEGVGIMEIMLAMGHRRLNTTQRYLEHIGATRVVGVTQGREW